MSTEPVVRPAPATPGALEVLQRIRRPRPLPRPGERCELCAAEVADEHSHLVRIETRSLLCTCRPCWLLFTSGGAGGGQYRAVPDRYLALPGLTRFSEAWDDLQIPVSVAFFFRNSAEDRVVAFYPSPAGATECLLGLDAWPGLADADPALATMEADVEALLVRVDRPGPGRLGSGGPACFVVPIDACYELVGHLRLLWRGFDGGQEAHDALDAFFDRLRDRAGPPPGGPGSR